MTETGADRRVADISVVIVHYETPDWLERCLAALAATSAPLELEIVTVDNASTNFDAGTFRTTHPDVRLIVNERNLGFATAVNRGLSVAHGRYVLLLNPDALVAPDTLGKMLELMDDQTDIGCSTARLVRSDGTLDAACRRSFPTPRRAFFRLSLLTRLLPRNRWVNQYNLGYLDEFQDADIDSPSGAFMLVRRATVEQVGGLDERYFMYGEDLDWAFRMKSAGWRIVYTARTTVRHEKRASSRLDRARTIRQFHDAMRIFYRVHYANQYPRIASWLIYRAIDTREAIELAAEAIHRSLHRSSISSQRSAT